MLTMAATVPSRRRCEVRVRRVGWTTRRFVARRRDDTPRAAHGPAAANGRRGPSSRPLGETRMAHLCDLAPWLLAIGAVIVLLTVR
jgi:hypothetical protein